MTVKDVFFGLEDKVLYMTAIEEVIDNGGLCPSCNKEPAAEPHTCPFAFEIHKDESLCTCCDDCTQKHADDI